MIINQLLFNTFEFFCLPLGILSSDFGAFNASAERLCATVDGKSIAIRLSPSASAICAISAAAETSLFALRGRGVAHGGVAAALGGSHSVGDRLRSRRVARVKPPVAGPVGDSSSL